jgi:enamine deaminase RidA (YjgF/YER057c/UK114 family)
MRCEGKEMIERFDTNARLSRVAVHNGLTFIAGTGPDTATASTEDQTREVLAKIDDLLPKVVCCRRRST